MPALRRFLLRLLSFFRAERADTDLAREIQAHLQLLEDKFVAQGMSAEEAHFAARRAFGGVEQVKERQREIRTFRWLDESRLDFKLGARMLIKHPGLTLVGGLGIAVAVAIAAGAFSIIYTLLDPALPLHEGDRIVAIQNWDAAANRPERRIVHDVIAWRAEVRSIHDIGAFRQVHRNLFAPGAQAETVRVAEMSAAGFRVARVPPLIGRHLVDDDEREGATPVLVIGYDVWRNRFAAKPDIVGRTVLLGETTYSIVGVIPEGFAFPVSNAYWVPLGGASRHERRAGPDVAAFGRLASGATLESAQAELTALGQRTAAAFPRTHEHMRPRVMPYTYPFFGIDEPQTVWIAHFAQFLITLLLVIVSVNVAILVYARTVTRHGEIAIRSALGAGRRRIVAQLFIEALVLTAAATAAGLAITSVGLSQIEAAMSRSFPQLPFWWNFRLSSGVIAYVVGLTLLAAAIVGVLPALKATGRRVQTSLRTLSAGSGSRMQLGGTWTVLIVAQVAFAVALLPPAVFHAWESIRLGTADPGFAAEEFLNALVTLERPAAPSGAPDTALRSRYGAAHAELMRRLRVDPAVSDATFSAHVPGQEPTVWIEAEGVPMPSESEAEASGFAVWAGKFGHETRFNRVDVEFFRVFGVPTLAGRPFNAADATPAASAVIVNRSFAQRVFAGGDALGRRVRYVGKSGDARSEQLELGRWYEIVGIVPDFPAKATSSGVVGARLYHAAAPGQVDGVNLAVRVRGTTPAAFAGRLREVSAAVDPNLQLRNVLTIDELLRQEQSMLRLLAAGLAILTMSVVLLSGAGIYALMSFTVTQRRKEIGIRAALGADPRRILGSIFARALGQLAIGAVVGAAAAVLLESLSRGDLMAGNGEVVLPVVALFMTAVGLVAAIGPARRGLRIQPIEALREP